MLLDSRGWQAFVLAAAEGMAFMEALLFALSHACYLDYAYVASRY